jgi:hypothetical protein
MATANRTGAGFCALLLAGVSLYMLLATATGSQAYAQPAWFGYLGAGFFALVAVWCARIARRPEIYDPDRPPLIGRLADLLQAAAFIFAALAGFDWLVWRFLGRAEPPNEIQRAGLYLLAAVAGLLLLGLTRAAIRRRTRGDVVAQESPSSN